MTIDARIKGRGQRPQMAIDPSTRLDNFECVIDGDDCVVRIGRDCRLPNLRLYLIGHGTEVHIGDNVVCNSSLWANLSGHKTRFVLGDGCLLANVRVRTSDSHRIFDASSGVLLNPPGDVLVGARVWIAEDVLLLKNTVVGDDCVIGAKSLVNRHIPPGSLAAGVPAKVLRSGIRWEV